MDEYDVIVLGGGSTGENVAGYVVQGGLSAALIESSLVGGECSYYACMPSKALLRGPDAVRAAREIRGASAAVTGDLDVTETFARRDGFTSHWDDGGQAEWVNSSGITLLRGHGRIVGERRVQVGDDTIRARHAVVVCTGSAARVPDIPGLAEVEPWTNREATSSHSVPGRLAVLGAGPVGVEMATAYAQFGAEVTVINTADRLLPKLESFAGDMLAESMQKMGIEVRNGTRLTSAARGDNGEIILHVEENGSGEKTVLVDTVLVATGRRPNTDDIGVEIAGLTPGEYLSADGSGHVAGGWLYAAGDATGAALLTHMGKYQARICGTAIAAAAHGRPLDTAPYSEHVASAVDGAVPAVVFTDPIVASVGRTEAEARTAGLRVRTVEFDLGSIAGAALHRDGYTGRAKLVVDEDREVIVGATFAGPDAAELLHAATVAVVGEVPMSRLWHAVPAYPTISEIWLRLLETDRSR